MRYNCILYFAIDANGGTEADQKMKMLRDRMGAAGRLADKTYDGGYITGQPEWPFVEDPEPTNELAPDEVERLFDE